jgi:hypothetical protein
MPEGIVSVRIDRETGCPARAGQTNAIFEVFEAGRVPECELADNMPDVFNDSGGMGDLFGGENNDPAATGEAADADPDAPASEEDEPPSEEDLF